MQICRLVIKCRVAYYCLGCMVYQIIASVYADLCFCVRGQSHSCYDYGAKKCESFHLQSVSVLYPAFGVAPLLGRTSYELDELAVEIGPVTETGYLSYEIG